MDGKCLDASPYWVEYGWQVPQRQSNSVGVNGTNLSEPGFEADGSLDGAWSSSSRHIVLSSLLQQQHPHGHLVLGAAAAVIGRWFLIPAAATEKPTCYLFPSSSSSRHMIP
ncbi:hypothetical protein CLOM_g17115 [Closterium sp. NIES-68]|nr:hypothetical protein CLOM_g17115 [Closterium sp. NIES-68]